LAKIRIKITVYSKKKGKRIGKFVLVDVANKECKSFNCLQPGRWTHQSQAMGNRTFQDNNYSCMFRNYHGCPDNPEMKEIK